MNPTPALSLTPREVVRLLLEKRKLWIGSAVACGLLASAYALVAPRYWEASQALVVRQETAGSVSPVPGKFADLYEMRTLQETILEMAKSQQVVVATLQAVDRQLNAGQSSSPTAEDIEKFRSRLNMLPPHGGEFGKTEVFYLYMKDTSRERAILLVSELCRQLDEGLKNLRAARAGGLVIELQEQVALATASHAEETAKLVEFESQVGSDLGELRMLHSASSGQSDLRQEAVLLESDIRRLKTSARDSEQLLALLQAAVNDPQQLVATPNSLLTSQPALRRLKDGLVDAQLVTARTAGTRSVEHPRVRAAVEAEAQIRRDLHRELATAIKGAEVDLRLSNQRVASTQERLTDLQARLNKLAEMRATYSNRVAALDNSRISLDRARQNLSTARAAEAAARSGSLVTRIDQPETGPYPAGPGRTVIAGAGGVAGLMLGVGLVFLTAVPRTGTTPDDNKQPLRAAAARQAEAPIAPNVSNESTEPEWWETMPSKVKSASVPGVPSKPAVASVHEVIAMPATAAPIQKIEPRPDAIAARIDQLASQPAAWLPLQSEAPIEPATVFVSAPAPTVQPVSKQSEPTYASQKSVLPAGAGVLPSVGGALPTYVAAADFGGMSLQQALRAAGVPSSN